MGWRESGQANFDCLSGAGADFRTIVPLSENQEQIERVLGGANKKGQNKYPMPDIYSDPLAVNQLTNCLNIYYLFRNLACAAANLAIGTRGGEQLT